jgi:hypothetical protein
MEARSRNAARALEAVAGGLTWSSRKQARKAYQAGKEVVSRKSYQAIE